MPVSPVDASVDAAGARQRGVLENMSIHLSWLVEVAGRVVLCSRETERVRMEAETDLNV